MGRNYQKDPLLQQLQRRPPSLRPPAFHPALLDGEPSHRVDEKDVILLTEESPGRQPGMARFLPDRSYLFAAAAALVVVSVLFLFVREKGDDRDHRLGRGYGTAEQAPASTDEQEAPHNRRKALVISLSGKVQVHRDSVQTHPVGLHSGTTIAPGDTVQTAVNSHVEIMIGDGIVIKLEEKTRFVLESLHRVVGKRAGLVSTGTLSSGSMLGNIQRLNPSDEITFRTPTAIAGIRGTALSIHLNNGKTEVAAYEGAVELRRKADSGESPVENENKKSIAESLLLDQTHYNQAVVIEAGQKADVSLDEQRPLRPEPLEARRLKDGIEQSELLKKSAGATERKLLYRINQLDLVSDEQSIQEKYNRGLEKIFLKDGRVFLGIVASQEKDRLIIHSTSGIHTVKITDVKEIRFMQNPPEGRTEQKPDER